MRKFSLVVFPDETTAFRGLHALEVLHLEGTVSVYAAAVIERHASGALSVRKRSEVVLLGGGLGPFVGGGRHDLLDFDVRRLSPGTIGVIAVLSERDTPIAARMEMLGGKVVREGWSEVGEALVAERSGSRRS